MTIADLILKHFDLYIHGKLWLATKTSPHRKAFRPLDYSDGNPKRIIGECNSGWETSELAKDDKFILLANPDKYEYEKENV